MPVRRVRSPAARASASTSARRVGRPVDLEHLCARVLAARARRAGRRRPRSPCDMISTGVGEALRLLDVVRRHEDRRALRAERVDQRPELLAHLRVEADRRLVHQHEPRLVHERARDQQARGASRRRACRRACRARSTRFAMRERALDRVAPLARGRSGRGARRRAGSAPPSASTSRLSSCGTTPHCARAGFDSSGSRNPSTSSSPSSAIDCAVRSRIVVDLPAPFGPSRPTHVPVGHVEVEAVDGRDRAVALHDSARDGWRARSRVQ